MRRALLVADDFDPPTRLVTPAFVLEPLGPQHNERDYAAWTSSMEHILATPASSSPGRSTHGPTRWRPRRTSATSSATQRTSRRGAGSPTRCSTRLATM